MNIKTPQVTIIILNWNGKEDTLECLKSIKKISYDNYDVVVVDNGSSDGSVIAIKEKFPKVKVIETGKNLGYAGGNNVGIHWALNNGADYIFVLNNDTIVDPDILFHLVDEGLKDSQLGLLGPKNYFYNEPEKVWAVGARLVQPSIDYEILGNGDHDNAWKVVTEVDALVGSAMLISKGVFEKVDLFDERFFMYWEEFDLCERARKAGYKCSFVPKAKIWHKVGSSAGEMKSPFSNYFNIRNRLLWATKHLSWSQKFSIHVKLWRDLIFPQVSSLKFNNLPDASRVKTYYWWLRSFFIGLKKRYHDPVNRAKFLGLRDYVLGRFGDCPESVRKLNKLS